MSGFRDGVAGGTDGAAVNAYSVVWAEKGKGQRPETAGVARGADDRTSPQGANVSRSDFRPKPKVVGAKREQ